MNKEDIMVQINKIYQALNAVSVQGYGNVKTLGNCLDAIQMEQLMQEQANDSGVIPINSAKPKPKRIKESGEKIGEN